MTTATIIIASGDAADETYAGAVTVADDQTRIGGLYALAGYIFRTSPIPAGATVQTALFLDAQASDLDSGDPQTINVIIRGGWNPADFAETTDNISDQPKTTAYVSHDETVTPVNIITFPNMAAVIQEIVDYTGYAENDDIALFLIDAGSSDFAIYGLDTYELTLFLQWTIPVITGELDYGWPGDYWPDEYWSEYWPDYGTATPGTSMGPIAFMHLQRMHRRSSL